MPYIPSGWHRLSSAERDDVSVYVVQGASGDEALRLAREAGMTSLEGALHARLTELCADEPDRCPTAEPE